MEAWDLPAYSIGLAINPKSGLVGLHAARPKVPTPAVSPGGNLKALLPQTLTVGNLDRVSRVNMALLMFCIYS